MPAPEAGLRREVPPTPDGPTGTPADRSTAGRGVPHPSLWRSSAAAVPLTVLVAFVLVSALLVGALYWQASRALTRQAMAQAEGEVGELAAEAGSYVIEILVHSIARRIATGGRGLYLLEDQRGRRLAGNLTQWPAEVVPGNGAVLFTYSSTDAAGRTANAGRRASEASSTSRIAVGVATALEDGHRLLVGRNVDEARALARSLWWWFVAAVSLMSVLGLAAMLASRRALLARVAAIRDTSERIMAGDLAQRIALTGRGDELDSLAQSLNVMLARIEQLMIGLKDVSDNIAHDLRTPLTRIRSSLEAALRDQRGGVAHREGLEHALEGADDLIKTFNALLLVARLEAGAVERTVETFDASALIADLAELYDPVADDAGYHLALDPTLNGPAPVMVRANRQLVMQALTNLIENALKYAEPMAPVAAGRPHIGIGVAAHEGGVEFVVADRGPGIAPEHRDKALKRFVRLDASRTQPGTGLGLSLVAAVARLHGGTVRLEDNEPGLRVRLVIPDRRSLARGDVGRG